MDDLFEEMERGERLMASGDECDWARDYERSLLPAGTVFPRGGQVWEAVDECEAQVEYVFAAPAGFSGKGRLGQGERIRIMDDTPDPQPILVSFLPVRYDELHDTLVPPDVRSIPRYTDYALTVKTGYFNAHFKLVEDVVEPNGRPLLRPAPAK